MLELRLRSGQIVSFDGRVLEVFAPDGVGRRLHIAKIAPDRAAGAGGGSVVTLDACRLEFTPEEAPACERLLAALADARRADARVGARITA